jgi:DNA replication licensing factor MCM4
VHFQSTISTFRSFLLSFSPGGALSEPLYLRRLREAVTAQRQTLNVDAKHIAQFGTRASELLYRHLVTYPGIVVPVMDLVVKQEADAARGRMLASCEAEREARRERRRGERRRARRAALQGGGEGRVDDNDDGAEEEDDEDEDEEEEDGGGAASALLELLQRPDQPSLRVRLFNLALGERQAVRDLNPAHIETLVSIRGMVIRVSAPTPDMRAAYFRCSRCDHGVLVHVDRGRVEEPAMCAACGGKHGMEMQHNRCEFGDKQLIKLQETPESIPEGETPHTVVIFAYEDLVDSVVPGDRVQVTGVYRAIPQRPNPRMRTCTAVFKTFVDAVHFEKTDKARLASEGQAEDGVGAQTAGSDAQTGSDARDAEGGIDAGAPEDDASPGPAAAAAAVSGPSLAPGMTPGGRREEREREARVRAMSADPRLFENLSRSLAPSIWELEDVKKGLLLQLFGGVCKNLGKEGKLRAEPNVLLVGDPGMAKSQLLSYVHKVSARGIYTSGKGSSAVGLTASIIKDPDTREPVLESGAIVLSDRGICCIDEFDKMTDATRVVLHEVMEQQTVSIAKAGIIATLNARTSILAAANPVESRYNPNLSVVENIKLPPTLLSRFDLIYLVLDPERADADRQLAQHLVALFMAPEDRPNQGRSTAPYSVAQLTEYISFARAKCQPIISDAAKESMWRGYVDMRRTGVAGAGGRKSITATTRQLESIIRLSEAHARMRLSRTVDADDVAEAIRLMRAATLKAAVDPRTGRINMDMLQTGKDEAERNQVALLVESLRERLQTRPHGASYTVATLIKEMSAGTDMTISTEDIVEALRQLATEPDPLIRVQGNSKVTILA